MTDRKLHPWDELKREGEKLRPAHVYAAQRDWPGYFAAVAGKPARETLLRALELFEEEDKAGRGAGVETGERCAIDLGCGEGRDTVELLRRGWRVLAIDGHPEAFERLEARPDLPNRERLATRLAPFEGLTLPRADLVCASFALPFCGPGSFEALWRQIEGCLASGGRFAGQLFGERDGWAKLPDRSHHTREQALGLLSSFDLEMFTEEEKDGKDATENPKHWHVFHVVARKR